MNIHRRDRDRIMLQLDLSRYQTLPTLPFYDLTIDPDSMKGWSSHQGRLVANVEQSSEMYQIPSGRPSNELLPLLSPPRDLTIDNRTAQALDLSEGVSLLELHQTADRRMSIESLLLFHTDSSWHDDKLEHKKKEEEEDKDGAKKWTWSLDLDIGD